MMSLQVGIITWASSVERIKHFRSCLDAVTSQLICQYGFTVLCSAEHDVSEVSRQSLESICWKYDAHLIWHMGQPNEGNNLNRLLRAAYAEYVLVLNDDIALYRLLDVTPAIDLLREQPDVLAVFYPCCGPHRSPHFGSAGTVDGFQVMDLENPWIMHASQLLVRRNFLDTVGEFVEDQPHGAVENDMNARLKQRQAIVAFTPEVYFEHVGVIRANGTQLWEKACD